MEFQRKPIADSHGRRSFIGGSDARMIMGNDAPALLRLWQEKRGEVEPGDLSGDLLVQLGNATEPLNRYWHEKNTGQAVTHVQRRIMASQGEKRFILACTREAKDFLMKKGMDTHYGARHLRRAIEQHLVIPLSSLIASGQIAPGDDLVVDCLAHVEALTFSKSIEVRPLAASVSA